MHNYIQTFTRRLNSCLQRLVVSRAVPGRGLAVTSPVFRSHDGKRLDLLALAITISAGSFLPAVAETPAADSDRTASLRRTVEYLASDELRGRSVADDSINVAADYIASQMSDIGLDMTAMDGGCMQPVGIDLELQAGSAERNFATFRVASARSAVGTESELLTIRAELADQFMPMSIGISRGEVRSQVTFVGYGIQAPELDYDEYAGIDVTGHAVIILRKEPQASDPSSKFSGVKNTRHAYFATKVQNAIDRGASAILLVNDESSTEDAAAEIQTRISGELERKARLEKKLKELPGGAFNTRQSLRQQLDGINTIVESMKQKRQAARAGVMDIGTAGRLPAGGRDGQKQRRNVPVVSLSRTIAKKLLEASIGKSLRQIETSIDGDLMPRSRHLTGVSVHLGVEIKPTRRISNNVIGVLPGQGSLAGQTVIVGAHYDHVGMGGNNSLAPGTIAVHNGADDNASGTAALLESAQRIKDRLDRQPNHRRIVFIAFTGEERGLLGSKHYVRNPRFPLSRTVTMINLDMVGRLRENTLTVYGVGTADQMDQIVEASNANLAGSGGPFELNKILTGYGPSDHRSFYEAGVPVLFYFTGLHDDYHRPSDDFDKIDFGGLTRITDIVTESCCAVATNAQPMTFSKTERSERAVAGDRAYLGVSLAEQSDASGGPVVVVTAVAPESPAESSGLRIDDIILRIGDQKVSSIRDVLSVIRASKPGRKTTVKRARGGEITVVSITLGSRN